MKLVTFLMQELSDPRNPLAEDITKGLLTVEDAATLKAFIKINPLPKSHMCYRLNRMVGVTHIEQNTWRSLLNRTNKQKLTYQGDYATHGTTFGLTRDGVTKAMHYFGNFAKIQAAQAELNDKRKLTKV